MIKASKLFGELQTISGFQIVLRQGHRNSDELLHDSFTNEVVLLYQALSIVNIHGVKVIGLTLAIVAYN